MREYANARIRDSCGRVLVIKENALFVKPARMEGGDIFFAKRGNVSSPFD